MNNGMPVSSSNYVMVKQIHKVIPTHTDRINQVLEKEDNAQLIYNGGRQMQWELVFRPDNEMLEEIARSSAPDLSSIQANWDDNSVCLSANGKTRWIHRGETNKPS
jgi:hypothetical protein